MEVFMIMNKKILIGSIVVVAILVLVSFTGVVGYQTTQSSTIARASPLFCIRINRAIDEESKDIACDYVGKGEEIIIPLPVRINRELLSEKIKDRISKMDVDEINHFKHLFIDKLCNSNTNIETDILEGNKEAEITDLFSSTNWDYITVFPKICLLVSILIQIYFGIIFSLGYFFGIIFSIVYFLITGEFFLSFFIFTCDDICTYQILLE